MIIVFLRYPFNQFILISAYKHITRLEKHFNQNHLFVHLSTHTYRNASRYVQELAGRYIQLRATNAILVMITSDDISHIFLQKRLYKVHHKILDWTHFYFFWLLYVFNSANINSWIKTTVAKHMYFLLHNCIYSKGGTQY